MLTSFPSPLFENATIWPNIDEDYNLDIFEMISNTNEPTKKPINMELLIFKVSSGCNRFQMFFSMVRETWIYGFLHLDSLLIKS